jgi:hypothetical protein
LARKKIGPHSDVLGKTVSCQRVLRAGILSTRASLDAYTLLSPAFQAISGAASSFSGVAVLAFVIAFHEAGHFLAARLQASLVLI